jgi:hypothetical protein
LSDEIPAFDDWFLTITRFETDEESWDIDDRFVCLPPLVVNSYLRGLLLEVPTLCQGHSSQRVAASEGLEPPTPSLGLKKSRVENL